MKRRGFVLAALTSVLLSPLSPRPVAAAAEPEPRCFARPATIVGPDGAETIRGTPGDDVIVGGGLGQSDLGVTIHGLGGDDRICVRLRDRVETQVYGGPGDDHLQSSWKMFGGAGDDVLVEPVRFSMIIVMIGGRGDDLMRSRSTDINLYAPGPGDDIAIAPPGIHTGNLMSFRGAHRGVAVNLREGSAVGQGDDALSDINGVYGSKYADVVIGDDRGNALRGFGGDDVLVGHGGRNFVEGGGGDDYVAGGKANDLLAGGNGRDIAIGHAGNDRLVETRRSEANVILAGPGNDRCLGNYPVPPNIERGCETHGAAPSHFRALEIILPSRARTMLPDPWW